MRSLKWTISQIGARQHYGVPRGFHHLGHLKSFHTDFWCGAGSQLLSRFAPALRAWAGRYHPDLPAEQVVSYNLRCGWQRLGGKRSQTTEATYLEYLAYGKFFGKLVTKHLAKTKLSPTDDAFFGFNTGCLETLQMLRERGILALVDQIDPARVEEQLVYQESLKWPGWQEMPGRIPDAYFQRLSAEWEMADFVVVNSTWSKRALVTQGVPEAKLLVVPVAYEALIVDPTQRKRTEKPLTVLWIGTVNLRKGIQYLLSAATMLQQTSIRFVIAGPVEISQKAVATAPSNVSFVGRIPRDRTSRYYQEADLFVLPTISDGFAITQVEAMAWGLPVITTRNCGEVVTHGIDGLLVNAGDGRELAEAIARLDADRTLLAEMAEQAMVKARTFQLPRQVEQIEKAIKKMRAAA